MASAQSRSDARGRPPPKRCVFTCTESLGCNTAHNSSEMRNPVVVRLFGVRSRSRFLVACLFIPPMLSRYKVELMRRLRQFCKYFFFLVLIGVVVAPVIDKNPVMLLYLSNSQFGLSLFISLVSASLVSVLLGLTMFKIFLKQKSKQSSLLYSVMVEVDGKKVFVEVPSYLEAKMLSTRFNSLNPTIYMKRGNFTFSSGKRIETEQNSTSSITGKIQQIEEKSHDSIL
jgi:hypothetical protein